MERRPPILNSARRAVFVQGNSSWFFLRLGKALDAAGFEISRITVCGGDRVFWGDWRARDYRGRREDFEAFIGEHFDRAGCTDLVLHNDCRPYHRIAIEVARARGITVWCLEEGYLRPNWLCLEKDGLNGYSRLPDDPAWYRRTAASLPDPPADAAVGAGFRERVRSDFIWQGANYAYLWRYPHYRTHRPYPIWAEYLTWLRRLAVLKRRHRKARALVDEFLARRPPFFLYPLQLDSDSQIRVHSRFGRLVPSIEAVIASFAAHAPREALLVVKNHPLDNAWLDLPRITRRIARAHGVAARVRFIDGGNLDALNRAALGVITVNSTAGLTALTQGAAVFALGEAVYRVPGLVAGGTLDAFWSRPQPPDAALLADFLKVLRHASLVNGNYYTEEGIARAVAESVQRIGARASLLDDAPTPRRLAGSAAR
jgi:capsular polysaccharide export protein